MCETTKPRKTQTTGELLEFLSGEFGPDKQNVLFEMFQEFPIWGIRKACVEKIIPAGKENFLWLADKIKEYLDIGDHNTVLFLLKKVAQYKTMDCKDHTVYGLILVVLNEWIKKDNRPALRDGLHILYDKIKGEKLYVQKETRVIFQSILEKYDNNEIERTEDDFKMLDDLVVFIRHIDRDYFIPVLKKNVRTWEEFLKMQKPGLSSCGLPFSQIMFEMDRGLIAGNYKEIADAAKAKN